MNRIPLMARRIIWRKFYAALELFLRCRPVPIVIHQDMRQRRVRFGECVIQCQRLYCRFFCLWHRFVRRGEIVKRQGNVGIRQAGVAESEIRIALDALLEVLDRVFDSVRRALVPKMSVSLRSNVSAQTWESLAALISWTLTRTASPLFWTLPSRM